MYKYVIMGIQGCGKGTQARLLCEAYDFVHISVGNQFRWHIANHTQLAAKINRIVSTGGLVGDDLVNDLVSERLGLHDWNYGFVLDGFPRTFGQAEFLFENFNVDKVIHMDARVNLVRARMEARRVCPACGADYNLIGRPPKKEGRCDACGTALITRSDDYPEAIDKRIREYQSKTEPMLRYFRRLGIVVDIQADQPIAQVHEAVKAALGLPAAGKLNTVPLKDERPGTKP